MADESELKVKLSAIDDLSPALAKVVDAINGVGKKIEELGAQTNALGGKMPEVHGGLLNWASAAELAETSVEALSKIWETLEHTVERAVDAALDAEKSQNKLTGALVATGNYSKDAMEKIGKYSEAVREEAGVNAELTKSHIAMGVQMGLTIEKSEEMEQASRKLALLTGGDLDSAFGMLQRSLTGQTRGLAMVLPQIKDLGTAQMKSGAAIDFVNKTLEAQTMVYNGSFSQGLKRAQSGIEEVYKELGNLIIQNPVIKEAMNGFAELMTKAAEKVKEFGTWLTAHQADVSAFGTALVHALEVGAIAVAAYGVACLLATPSATILAGAIALATSPITLIAVGVAALTAAFYKWPGLFDIITGSLKVLIALALTPAALAIGTLTYGIGKLVSIVNKDMGASLQEAGSKLMGMTKSLALAGVEQVKTGAAAIAAGGAHEKLADSATKAGNAEKDAADKALAATNARNLAMMNTVNMYGRLEDGTRKQREGLEAEKQARDKAFGDFKKYYQDKVALAVSKEAEEAQNVASYKASLLGKDTIAGVKAEADATALINKNGTVQLKAELDARLISKEAYAELSMKNLHETQSAELAAKLAQSEALEKILGQSTEAEKLQLDIKRQQNDLETSYALQQAEMEGASIEQLNALKIERTTQNEQDMAEIKETYLQKDVQRQEKLGKTWETTLAKIRLEQAKHGKLLGAMQAIQNSTEYKSTNQMFTDLGALRTSHSKTAFELGKKAAIAQATVQTFMAATEAYASLAGIPLIGPALGIAAAAAAVGAGFVNIQHINEQQFSPQAHGGLDSVPADLDNKTFLLKGGERVVQPEANKDLTNYLASANQGGGKTTIMATVNLTVNGSANQTDMRSTAEMLVSELRRMSERGELIVSSKGVY